MERAVKTSGLTYEDYLALPEDGKRYEVVRGELFVTPAPAPKHQIVISRLMDALLRFKREQGLRGEVLTAPIDVVLAEDTFVQPDILFIPKERLSIIGEKAILGPPDLAIEVHSPSTHKLDHVTKRKAYAELGVREYWIVDPELEQVEVFVLEEGRLDRRAEVLDGEVRSLAAIPGLGIPLAEIFS